MTDDDLDPLLGSVRRDRAFLWFHRRVMTRGKHRGLEHAATGFPWVRAALGVPPPSCGRFAVASGLIVARDCRTQPRPASLDWTQC